MPGISINPFAARATTAGKHSCPCLNIFFSIFLHTFLFTWPGYKSRQVIPVLQPSQLPQQPMTCNQQDRMCLEVDCRCVRIFPLSNFAPENSKILFLDRMFPSAKRAKAVIWTWFSFPRWRNAGNVQSMQPVNMWYGRIRWTSIHLLWLELQVALDTQNSAGNIFVVEVWIWHISLERSSVQWFAILPIFFQSVCCQGSLESLHFSDCVKINS